MEVRRQGEGFAGIGQGDGGFVLRALAFVFLQQGDEFPEHLGNVGAVDLVDDEDVGQTTFGFAGAFRDALQHAALRDEAEARSLARLGAQALDELLVAVRLMEGDELDPAFFDELAIAAADVGIRPLRLPVADLDAAPGGGVGLPGPRWAVEDRVECESLRRSRIA